MQGMRRERKRAFPGTMLGLNHTDILFEKKGGGKGNSKGNHSSAEVNGKLPLTLTGEHSTQAS